MGAWNSIHNKLKEISDDLDGENFETDQETSTPERKYRHKCLMNLDPRSPTENIDRTPIIIDGTPNVQLSKGVKQRIASQNDTPTDPRSPSTDFTRTPLNFGQASDCDTPLKAPLDFALSSTARQDDAFSVGAMSTPDKLTTEERLYGMLSPATSSSETDNIVSTDDSSEESLDTAPLLEELEKIDLATTRDDKKSTSSGQGVQSTDSVPSQSKLRCRQVNKILNQHVPSAPPKARSPLTLVENSPRLSSLPKKVVNPSGGKSNYNNINSPVVMDKENICH